MPTLALALALTLTLTLTRYTNVVRRTTACRSNLQPRWDEDFHLLIRIEDELELLVEVRHAMHTAPQHAHAHRTATCTCTPHRNMHVCKGLLS